MRIAGTSGQAGRTRVGGSQLGSAVRHHDRAFWGGRPRRTGPSRRAHGRTLGPCFDHRPPRTSTASGSRPIRSSRPTAPSSPSRVQSVAPSAATAIGTRSGSCRPTAAAPPRQADPGGQARQPRPVLARTGPDPGLPRPIDGRSSRTSPTPPRIVRTARRSTSCPSTAARPGGSPTCRAASAASRGRPTGRGSSWQSVVAGATREEDAQGPPKARAAEARHDAPARTTATSTGSRTCSTGRASSTTR